MKVTWHSMSVKVINVWRQFRSAVAEPIGEEISSPYESTPAPLTQLGVKTNGAAAAAAATAGEEAATRTSAGLGETRTAQVATLAEQADLR